MNCKNCEYYHGQIYNGEMLVCAVHPRGNEDCSDFVPSEKPAGSAHWTYPTEVWRSALPSQNSDNPFAVRIRVEFSTDQTPELIASLITEEVNSFAAKYLQSKKIPERKFISIHNLPDPAVFALDPEDL